ncbi:hypothetical protein AGJ19_09240 [Cronobacter sakazakii]|uniref:putative type VI secretion system effector n=1 Tax=Cronobacter sakazakii TaxID=28141 RepID=UPI000CFB5668|nr:putative type VI secretion system effector [Cronobacter sakazakii]EGT5702503.1 hypothetical protein [Cronobacter sakazakii]EJG0830633.1 hypothetical protein [Cronobacter sakazakii]PQY51914.1 hypothetical protein C5959_00980 [Cronobacter sakazakii]
MKPNRYLSWKEAIDFDQIKSQISSKETCIEVNMQWISDHPNTDEKLKLEQEINSAQDKLTELKNLLSKEPPLPELPPLQPLVKVSGILDEIQTMVVKGYFSAREYEPDEFARQESRRQWGSVLLAAIGESAAATVNAQDEIRSADVYHFIQGKIDGKPFYGWTGMVTARAGDRVELAAVDKGDHLEVYALAVPALRVISVLPRCDMSIDAYIRSGMKITHGLLLLLFVPGALTFFSTHNYALPYLVGIVVLWFALDVLAVEYSEYLERKKIKPPQKMAERIFAALGFSKPADVHLPAITRRKVKALKKNGVPDDRHDERVMPGPRGESHYFYY